MVHHMQRSRQQNLKLIGNWVQGIEPEKIDRAALARRAMLLIGCTREKAHEYIRIILGDEA